MPMRKTIAALIPPVLMLLTGCSEIDQPDVGQESCDLCHSTSLANQAVHRLHLSNPAMANFPYNGLTPPVSYPVISGDGDTTFKFKVDPAFKFSNSATIDRATHYQQTRLLNEGIQCADCHSGLDSLFARNNDPNHRNGRGDPSFDEAGILGRHYNASDTAHYSPSAPGRMSFDGTGCNNIACHGAGRNGVLNVVWNPSPRLTDTLSCMGCHDTKTHKVGVACDLCHYDVTLDNGKTIHNFRKHFNDTINYGRY